MGFWTSSTTTRGDQRQEGLRQGAGRLAARDPQGRARRAARKPRRASSAFEGWDAAGKGGAIGGSPRSSIARLTSGPSPRRPTRRRAHHYLWRFWRRLPERGRWCVYDRSWYGRVLVERLEGFCSGARVAPRLPRAQRVRARAREHGVHVVKIFSPSARRSSAAASKSARTIRYKKWNRAQDWRNREHWDEYVVAAEQMFDETSAEARPGR